MERGHWVDVREGDHARYVGQDAGGGEGIQYVAGLPFLVGGGRRGLGPRGL